MTDTSLQPGRGTKIRSMLVGNQQQHLDSIPSWVFSERLSPGERAVCEDAKQLMGTCDETPAVREAVRLLELADVGREMSWVVWPVGLQVSLQIEFFEACEWQGVFWGKAIT